MHTWHTEGRRERNEGKWYHRRRLLSGAAVTAVVGFAGCASGDGAGDDPDAGNDEEPATDVAASNAKRTDADATVTDTTPTADRGGTGEDDSGCSPGHADGDAPCEQIAADATVLTGFDAAGTYLLTGFHYPCGWRRSTDQYDDRAQANVTRDDFDATVDVQIRNYTQPVEDGFLDRKRSEGDYDEVEYEYDGTTRTALVSSKASAAYGTLAHAVVPYEGSAVHVEFVSTLKAAECSVEPRPDYDVVRAMVQTIRRNTDSTFSLA